MNANKPQPVARLQKRVESYLGFSKLNDVVRVTPRSSIAPHAGAARYELLMTGDLDKISDEDFEHEWI